MTMLECKLHLTNEASNERTNERLTVQRHLATADELGHRPPGEWPQNEGC